VAVLRLNGFVDAWPSAFKPVSPDLPNALLPSAVCRTHQICQSWGRVQAQPQLPDGKFFRVPAVMLISHPQLPTTCTQLFSTMLHAPPDGVWGAERVWLAPDACTTASRWEILQGASSAAHLKPHNLRTTIFTHVVCSVALFWVQKGCGMQPQRVLQSSSMLALRSVESPRD